MKRYSSSHCNHPVGPCSCGGLYHNSSATVGNSNSFSMLFSSINPNHHHHHHQKQFNDHFDAYPISSSSFNSSSSPSVDCTLSLGTPSTRHQITGNIDNKSSAAFTHHRKSTSCVSNICWDIFQAKQNHHHQQQNPNSTKIINSRSSAGSSSSLFNNFNSTSSRSSDASVTRRCANCDTTSTPLWRNGPKGPKSLCNACGIRYKKEERRATSTAAAAATTTNGSTNAAAAATIVEPQQQGMMSHHHQQHNSSWAAHNHHSHNTQRVTNSTTYPSSSLIGNHEFRFIEDHHHHRDSNSTNSSTIPFLSWRLNVAATDRPSQLVHDYT